MSNRKITSTVGLISSFVGMAGLVLSIISLIPLNSYNLYTTLDTLQKLILFEQKRTGQDDWHNIQLSTSAKLYFIFLSCSFISSLSMITTTFVTCCQHQAVQHTSTTSKHQRTLHKSWFLRFICLALLIQIATSIFGTHLVYRIKTDVQVIPLEIQHNAFITCAILWINYLSIIIFSLILLFASFCILIGSHKHASAAATISPPSLRRQGIQDLDDETRPLMTV
ncbi:hypothetical protein BD408DRAFT_410079 [Parasitella parasitica]|nr:hypothetical protein BD408DRAFT_410079 [Parasitella parasitica]